MKNVISKIITHVLSIYIDPIQCNQLEVALWAGKAKIQDLKLKESSLAVHDLPFNVKKGIIKSTEIYLPWSSLQSDPCVINIDGVYLVANVQAEVLIKSQLQIKKSILQQIEQACEENNVKGDKQNGFFSNIFHTVLNNLQINIKNVHIRIEMNQIEKGKTPISAGITMKELKLVTINENGEEQFMPAQGDKQFKKLTVDSLSK